VVNPERQARSAALPAASAEPVGMVMSVVRRASAPPKKAHSERPAPRHSASKSAV